MPIAPLPRLLAQHTCLLRSSIIMEGQRKEGLCTGSLVGWDIVEAGCERRQRGKMAPA
ncbi:hypothetical protein SK128_021820, partial [Halocaridina rubra]